MSLARTAYWLYDVRHRCTRTTVEITPVHIPIASQGFFFFCLVSYLASIGKSCLCYRSRPSGCSVRRLCALIGCLGSSTGLARAVFVLRRSCAKRFLVASGSPSGTSEAGRTDDARGAEVVLRSKGRGLGHTYSTAWSSDSINLACCARERAWVD